MNEHIFGDLAAKDQNWATLDAVAIGASIADTGATLGGKAQENLSGTAAMILTFSGVSAIAVLSSVATLAVTLQQRSYALWQLILQGAHVQFGAVTVLSSILGVCGIALLGG